jgi:hypothetical protein
LIKGTTHQEDITIVNTYTLDMDIDIPNLTKQILLDIKVQIDSNTIILGNFNITLLLIGRLFIQKKKRKKLQNEIIL